MLKVRWYKTSYRTPLYEEKKKEKIKIASLGIGDKNVQTLTRGLPLYLA